MKQKLEEIKSAATVKDIETMYIVADFSKLLTLDDYRNTIESKLIDLDVRNVNLLRNKVIHFCHC